MSRHWGAIIILYHTFHFHVSCGQEYESDGRCESERVWIRARVHSYSPSYTFLDSLCPKDTTLAIQLATVERIRKVTKKCGNWGRCRKLSLWNCKDDISIPTFYYKFLDSHGNWNLYDSILYHMATTRMWKLGHVYMNLIHLNLNGGWIHTQCVLDQIPGFLTVL